MKQSNQTENGTQVVHEIPLSIRLGYRNSVDALTKWSVLAENKKIQKKFACNVAQYTESTLDCDLVQLFELGSVHHEFYLINLKLLQLSTNPIDDFRYSVIEMPDIEVMLTVSDFICILGFRQLTGK
jgi:hypothetical protein